MIPEEVQAKLNAAMGDYPVAIMDPSEVERIAHEEFKWLTYAYDIDTSRMVCNVTYDPSSRRVTFDILAEEPM